MLQEKRVVLEGLPGSGLVLHNGALRDPFYPYTREIKKITAKKKKTDEDHMELYRLEFLGSLYLDADKQVVMPGENIEAMMADAAAKLRLKQVVQAGLFVKEEAPPLEHDGPASDPEALWADERFRFIKGANVSGRGVMRSRPRFRQWRLGFTFCIEDTLLDMQQVEQCLKVASVQIGLGDWTPRYGRFTVKKF